MRRLLFVTTILALTLLPLTAQLAVTYQVADLGVIPGWEASAASRLNWLSQVTGNLIAPTAPSTSCHAFLWDLLSGMRDIGTVKDFCAQGTKVDVFGRVGGTLRPSDTTTPAWVRAVFYSPGSPMVDIGTLYPGDPSSWAELIGMNNRAEIVGYSHENNLPDSHAFYWSRTAGILDLHPHAPYGTLTSLALNINDSGRIVGDLVADSPGSTPHAFYMTDRSSPMVDLTTRFPGIPAGMPSAAAFINNQNQVGGEYKDGANVVAFFIPDVNGTKLFLSDPCQYGGSNATRDMNKSGQIIGECLVSVGPPLIPKSFRWTPGGAMEMLQPLAGDTGSAPIGMNNQGQVVGQSFVAANPPNLYVPHAVLWNVGTTVGTALPPLVSGGSCVATDINDFGVISGMCRGVNASGPKRAVIWLPRLSWRHP